MNIVENPKIHKELCKRWDELGLKSAHIIHDAEERGMLITPARISKYRNTIKYDEKWNPITKDKDGKPMSSDFKGSLTVAQLVWISFRYGINISINVGTLTLRDGKPIFKVMPFNELECIKKLHKVFPKTKVILKDLQNGEEE